MTGTRDGMVENCSPQMMWSSSLIYMKDHEGEFKWFDAISYIDDVEVIDDYTVVTDLSDPMVSFLVDIAGNVPIMPAHIWKDVAAAHIQRR